MHVRILSADLIGIDAYLVEIEVDVGGGLPGYHLVGLPATAVTEGRVRVRSALVNSGFELPARKITVNLAPAEVRKDTSAFDLPIALAVLAGLEQIPGPGLGEVMALGELSLDGTVRPVRGVLSIAMFARKNGVRCLIVPKANGSEACLVSGLDVRVAGHLSEVVEFIRGERELGVPKAKAVASGQRSVPDLSEVRGQQSAKRALEVAAAGGHHLLMVGPPGSGKSMLAHRIAGLMPPMTVDEALECTRIYSVAGLANGCALMKVRPFRAPHHTISNAGLVGGGHEPRPGELSLAHNGILFLDEVLEFRRCALESLRQPLEEKRITITRARATVCYPADILLTLALNPCPCGHQGDPGRTCVCSTKQVNRYQSRLSGPLLDRIDLHVEVPRLNYEELAGGSSGETSSQVRDRVIRARRLQLERLATGPSDGRTGPRCNGQMGLDLLRIHCRTDRSGQALLKRASGQLCFSARAIHRVLKVARTVADLEGSDEIRAQHVAEAVRYRALDWSRR